MAQAGTPTAFGKHAQEVTYQIKEASLQEARRVGPADPICSLKQDDKKAIAEHIAGRDRVEEGLICVLSCVEPCVSFEVGPNREKKRLELKHRLRKCLGELYPARKLFSVDSGLPPRAGRAIAQQLNPLHPGIFALSRPITTGRLSRASGRPTSGSAARRSCSGFFPGWWNMA